MGAEDWMALDLADSAGLADLRVVESDTRIAAGSVLLGLGTDGHRHLLIPQRRGTPIAEDHSSQGVRIETREMLDGGRLRQFGDVHCLVPHLNGLFATVADEMLDAIADAPDAPVVACSRVLDRWRELLRPGSSSGLGVEQLGGLFAELLVLTDVVDQDPALRIDCWTGPGRRRHDIRRADMAIEIKATLAREGLFVEIHGAEQLLPPESGQLWLSIARLETPPSGGRTVADLVGGLIARGVAESVLRTLLASAGYLAADEPSYSSIGFDVTDRLLYEVNADFPRIVPGSFVGGALPGGVMRLRYVVDLSGDRPEPLDDDQVSRVISRFARAG